MQNKIPTGSLIAAHNCVQRDNLISKGQTTTSDDKHSKFRIAKL